MSFYSFAKNVVKSVLYPIYQFKVIGVEHFPKSGGVLLCSNHLSAIDPAVVGILAPRPVHFMAKDELFSVPVLGKIIKKCHAFPVKRGLSDREALRKGLSVLKEGHVMGLFPEGTRSKTGELGKGLAGAGFFALRTDAQVVPVAIIGPYKPFRRLTVVYGKPIDMIEARKNKTSPEEVTEMIMASIRDLLNAHK